MRRSGVLVPCLAVILVSWLHAVTAWGDDAVQKEAPVFNNQDIERYKSPSDNKPADNKAAAAMDNSSMKKEKTRQIREDRDKEYWCKRASPFNRKIERAKSEVKEIEDESAVEKDKGFYAARKKTARALDKRLEKARRRLKDAEADLSDLGDEAHRKGIPPGWLRCQFE